MIKIIYHFGILALLLSTNILFAQTGVSESDYYQLEDLNIPDDIKLEVGGMDILPDGRLAVCTRRGEVWLLSNLYGEGEVSYTRFARGLHEPLGLTYHEGSIYCAQRGELTKMTDKNGDDKADVYETIAQFPLTGNYHEYHYGPYFLPDGDMLVTLNLGWEGRGVSKAKWRGWMLKISPDGKITPYGTGMRSPAGFGPNLEGDIFYTENQGDWVGSGRMTHVESGDFVGNPAGLRWASEAGSPLDLTLDEVTDGFGTMYNAKKQIPELKLPAVWFPHGIMGISTAEVEVDKTEGAFGPFAGQLLISDQGQSKIMRVFMEKVNDEYQGICFPFREGFASGLLRLVWGKEGTLFGGMTSRGWGSTGKKLFALQRLKWTGKVPFEMKAVRAQEDGFEIEFTEPVNAKQANDPKLYNITGFTYKYHHTYGSPVTDKADCVVKQVIVTDGGSKVKLVVDGLRAGYVHEIRLGKLTSGNGQPLLHDFGYYTLNNLPGGALGTGAIAANSSAEETKGSPKRPLEMPVAWGGKVDAELVIETAAGMKFQQTYLEVDAGAKVSLTLNNPDDMQHNWVLVAPKTSEIVGETALQMGLDGLSNNYVPKLDEVIYHTNLVEPSESEVIYFQAPSKPGLYEFICTVPGHYKIMRGVLKVK